MCPTHRRVRIIMPSRARPFPLLQRDPRCIHVTCHGSRFMLDLKLGTKRQPAGYKAVRAGASQDDIAAALNLPRELVPIELVEHVADVNCEQSAHRDLHACCVLMVCTAAAVLLTSCVFRVGQDHRSGQQVSEMKLATRLRHPVSDSCSPSPGLTPVLSTAQEKRTVPCDRLPSFESRHRQI